jgi:hypothetical protein
MYASNFEPRVGGRFRRTRRAQTKGYRNTDVATFAVEHFDFEPDEKQHWASGVGACC